MSNFPHDSRPGGTARSGIERLLAVMRRLRDPAGGCPWDIEQTFETIAPYTIEEAYEVADAILRGDHDDLAEELGDLLLQVAYHAQMAQEQGLFDFDAVAHAIADKMIRRHPHVFGDEVVADAVAQRRAWEETKALERAGKAAAREAPESVLDDLPLALPALTRAVKLQRRAARIGFDWPDLEGVLEKIREEIEELAEAGSAPDTRRRQEEELGDILFAIANLARHLEIDPEAALRACNAKFERRFRKVERAAAGHPRDAGRYPLALLDSFWEEAKAEERAAASGEVARPPEA
jgi:MazG family protein